MRVDCIINKIKCNVFKLAGYNIIEYLSMLIGAGHPLYEAYYGSYRRKDSAALRELLCRSAVLRPSDREKGENEWNSTNRLYFKASILIQLIICSLVMMSVGIQ